MQNVILVDCVNASIPVHRYPEVTPDQMFPRGKKKIIRKYFGPFSRRKTAGLSANVRNQKKKKNLILEFEKKTKATS